MKKSYITLIALAAVVITTAAKVPPARAEAPTTAKTTDMVTLDIRDTDIRSAVEILFRNSGKNFSIDQNVDGMIPAASFKDVSFDAALKNLLKPAGLIYRKDNDIYTIIKRPEPVADQQKPGDSGFAASGGCFGLSAEEEASMPRVEKIALNYSSPREILDMMTSSARPYTGFYGPNNGAIAAPGITGGIYNKPNMQGSFGSPTPGIYNSTPSSPWLRPSGNHLPYNGGYGSTYRQQW